MRARDILIIAVLSVSLGINALLLNEKLGSQFYQKGVAAGIDQLGEKLVKEVQEKRQLTVRMPDGKMVTLTVPEVKSK